MKTRDVDRTAQHWSAEATWEIGRGIYWLELPAVQRRLNRKVSGDPDVDWVGYSLDSHLANRVPLDRTLILGCGRGGLERQLAGLGAFVACDALDVAEGVIAEASELADQASYNHINYSIQDANVMQLPARQYDAVWASGSIHHLDQLEHVFDQVSSTLKPDGVFVFNEYIGPNRFQFPPRRQKIIQACHELLPPEYHRLAAAALGSLEGSQACTHWRELLPRVYDKLRDGNLLAASWRQLHNTWSIRRGTPLVKGSPNLPTLRSVKAVDPSEAVRSAEIMPLLRQRFAVVEQKPLGGSILQFLLAGIAGNFQGPDGERLLQMLFTIEDTLMACGALTSDFIYVLAIPRPSKSQIEEMSW